MADRTLEILTPATETDLATLEEIKLLMGISLTDTSDDQQLQLFIDMNSATVARLCNRTFARTEVLETWRDINLGHRLFLSIWPVQSDDLLSVESPAGTALDLTQIELEVDSGKLEIFTQGAWIEPVAVHYWGGYSLPGDAPLPLKQALSLLCVQSKLLASLASIAGMRMLVHRDKRVAFHDPMKVIEAAMGGPGSGTQGAVMNLLEKYMRIEV
jgi:hypothetical protein